MVNAEETMEETRDDLVALVKYERREGLGKMGAYARVASLVGVSAAFVRKVIGRARGVVIEAHEYLNIGEMCARLCGPRDAGAAKARRAHRLRRHADHQTHHSAPECAAGDRHRHRAA